MKTLLIDNNIFVFSVAIFTVILLNITIAKRLKYFGLRLWAYPTLSDILYSVILMLLVIFLVYLRLHTVGFVVLNILFLLLFFDISLFQAYSINLDYSALKLFFKNHRDFIKGVDSQFFKTIHSRKFYLYPLFTFVILLALLYDFKYESYMLTFYCVYIVFAIAKLRLNIATFVVLLTIALGLGKYFNKFKIYSTYDAISLNNFFALFSPLIAILLIKFLTKRSDKIFFRQNSKVLDFFNLKLNIFSKPNKLFKYHEVYSKLNYKSPTLSKKCQKIESANIIFITIESLNREIFEKIKPDFIDEYQITSNMHYSISSNTYESLHTIYNGTYYEKINYPYLKKLKEKGYKTIFFTPQELAFEDTDILLQNAGFETLISSDSESSNEWTKSDGAFYKNSYKKLKEKLNSDKFFLHILNSQTHLPYSYYESENTGAIKSTKQKYEASLGNALDELQNLLEKLQKDGFLNNTIVILTGDHGESFGELSYNAHSTSITKEQLNVPFYIYHKSLTEKQVVDFSTHFDILPTVFDLLDIKPEKGCLGDSIFSNKDNGFITYSKSKTNAIPTSFGYIDKKKKIFIDILYERYWITDLDDNVLDSLSGENKKEVLYMLYVALKNRALIK